VAVGVFNKLCHCCSCCGSRQIVAPLVDVATADMKNVFISSFFSYKGAFYFTFSTNFAEALSRDIVLGCNSEVFCLDRSVILSLCAKFERQRRVLFAKVEKSASKSQSIRALQNFFRPNFFFKISILKSSTP